MRRIDIYVITGYTILTLILTYPLILNLTTVIPGGADAYWYLWDFWWFKQAVLELNLNPVLHNPLIFYPNGLLMAITELSPFNGFLSIPLQEIVGIEGAYNLLVLSGFILSGYGMFLLVKHLTSDNYASFISGLIYTFSSYHFVEVFGINAQRPFGHINLATMEWIPFYVLYLLKLVKDPNPKNALLCSLFFFLAAMSTWQYMGFLALFTCLYALYLFFNERPMITKKLASYALLSAAVSFILLSPFVYPLIEQSLSGAYMSSSLGTAGFLSPDLIDFFIPSQLHPLFGKYSYDLHNALYNETLLFGKPTFYFYDANYLGWAAIFLALYYILIIRHVGSEVRAKISKNLHKIGKIKKRSDLIVLLLLILCCTTPFYLFFGGLAYLILVIYASLLLLAYYLLRENRMDFWAISFLFFLIMSLGPYLHIFGQSEFGPGKVLFFLPYTFFYYLAPLFSVFRTPARFIAMSFLSLSVISGYALKEIAKSYGKRIYLIVALLVLFEAAVQPFFATPSVPEIYKQISKDPGEYVILDVPVSFSEPTHKFLYYQTVHEKKIIGGYAPKTPEDIGGFMSNTPLISDLFFLRGNKTLITLGDGYLTVHQYADLRPANEDLKKLKAYIENKTPVDLDYGEVGYSLKDSTVFDENKASMQTNPLQDIISQNVSEIKYDVLQYYNVRYIVLHKDFLDPEGLTSAENILKEIPKDLFYEDKDLKIYLIQKQDYRKNAFTYLGSGWQPLEVFSEKPSRCMDETSTIYLMRYGKQNEPLSITFNATSHDLKRILKLSLNGKIRGYYTITPSEQQFTAVLDGTVIGKNTIQFDTDAYVPSDKYCRSIEFYKIQIASVENYSLPS